MADVPLADVSIRAASSLDTADEVAYLKALGPVLAAFPQITVQDYWNLTCAEHAALVMFINKTDAPDTTLLEQWIENASPET